jgi:hypothetical protein
VADSQTASLIKAAGKICMLNSDFAQLSLTALSRPCPPLADPTWHFGDIFSRRFTSTIIVNGLSALCACLPTLSERPEPNGIGWSPPPAEMQQTSWLCTCAARTMRTTPRRTRCWNLNITSKPHRWYETTSVRAAPTSPISFMKNRLLAVQI